MRTCVSLLLLWLVAAATADAQPARLHCDPACRPGFRCELGECIPSCEPACGSGFLCTESGCVREHAPPKPEPSPTFSGASLSEEEFTATCSPACGSGLLCIEGHCVSACNPPCPGGFACTEDLRCVVAEAEPTPPPSPARDSTADAMFNVHVNLAGPLQWGLAVAAEYGAKISGYLRLRPLNAGLVNYYLLTREPEDSFVWGLGGTLGTHIFSAQRGNLRGFYGGVGLGYFYVLTKDTSVDHARYATHALVPQADFGYRWALDHLLLGVGLRFGVSIPAGKRDKPQGPVGCRFPSSCDEQRRILPLPELVFDLGWFS